MLFIRLIHLLEAISAVKGTGVTAVKVSAGCVRRPKMTDLNNVSKDNSRSWVSKRVTYIDPQGRLKHMTGNKDLFTDYQDIDGGFVAFGGSLEWNGLQLASPEGEGSTTPLNPNPHPLLHNQIFHEPQTEAHIEQLLPSPTTYQRKRKTQKRRRTKKDTKLPQTSVPQDLGADEAVHKEGGMDTGGSPRRQDTMGGAPAQTRSERVLEQPFEPPLLEGHASGSGEGRMEHQFDLTANVLDLEKMKDAQAVEILRQKKRVKRLERERKSSTSQPRRRKYRQVESSDDDLDEKDASKQGRSSDKTETMKSSQLLCLVQDLAHSQLRGPTQHAAQAHSIPSYTFCTNKLVPSVGLVHKILTMSKPTELIPSPPTVRNTFGKGSEQVLKDPNRHASDAALREYCDKYYHQLLPIIAEKVHHEKVQQEKLKEVKARLNFEGCSGKILKIQEVSQHSESRIPNVRGDLRRRLRSRRSHSTSRIPEPTPSVFSKIRCDRSQSPRNGLGDKGRMEGGVFKMLRIKEEACPHTRRAATKVLIQEERNRSTKSVTIRGHLHGKHNHS
ncbi:hypothetical protein Tco_1203772 [Tanacetum coccineum]